MTVTYSSDWVRARSHLLLTHSTTQRTLHSSLQSPLKIKEKRYCFFNMVVKAERRIVLVISVEPEMEGL